MSANPRYYFFKLKADFFDGAMLEISALENGDACIVAYQKLIFASLENCGEVKRNKTEGYSVGALAHMLYKSKDETMKILEALSSVGLISIDENMIITILNFAELVGSETKDAVRKKIERAAKRETIEASITEDRDECATVKNEYQSQAKSNEQPAEQDDESMPFYDNQISLITLETESDKQFNENSDFFVLDKERTKGGQKAENVHKILDIRDKRLDIRDSVCISRNLDNLETHTREKNKIKLTKVEEDELRRLLGNKFEPLVEKIENYMQAYGKTYQDYYATIKYWALKDEEKLKERKLSKFQNVEVAQILPKERYTQRNYDAAFYAKLMQGNKSAALKEA